MAETILIVDDDPVTQELMRGALEADGHAVRGFRDAGAALEYYHQHWTSVTVVLLDCDQSDMACDELFLCLKAINPEVRVLLVTGWSPDSLTEMRDTGLYGVIRKPFHIWEVQETVRRTLAVPLP